MSLLGLTPLALAAIIMIIGYGIIAVPTGIVSAEFISDKEKPTSNRACRYCGQEGHAIDDQGCSERLEG